MLGDVQRLLGRRLWPSSTASGRKSYIYTERDAIDPSSGREDTQGEVTLGNQITNAYSERHQGQKGREML